MKAIKKSGARIITGAMTVATLLFTLASCHKDNSNNGTGTLYFNLQTAINANMVDTPGKLYPDVNGRLMSLTSAQFYISGIGIKNADGTWYNLSNTYLLNRMATQKYFVGNVPTGNYTNIRFNVGIDAANDTLSPNSFSATGPDSVLAAANQYNMFFGWQWMGYIFMNLWGKVDLSPAHDGSNVVPFSYEIGSGANLKNVVMPTRAFTISPNSSQTINIICDYGELLQSVNLSDSVYRVSDTYITNPSTAATISGFIPGMFRYEKIQ